VSHPRRKDEHIPLFHIDSSPLRTAQLNLGVAPRDAEDFVGGAMVVMVRKDAVPPAPLPLMSPIHACHRRVEVPEGVPKGMPEDENRQVLVVGKRAVIGKTLRLHLRLPENVGEGVGDERRHNTETAMRRDRQRAKSRRPTRPA